MIKPLVAGLLCLVLAACGSAKMPDTPEPEAALITAAATAASPVLRPAGKAESRARSAIVIDVNAGRILYEDKARELRYPASLTKLMTLFIVFEEIKAGRLSLDDQLTVSSTAAARQPAKIGVKAGTTITVNQAVQALSVKSANDVATVIAENLAGSEAAFARRMTRTARALGMNDTWFENASGLPDPKQVTTAYDMAVLGRAVKVRHPDLSRYFRARSFSYNGRTFKSTNKLLGTVRGVDGMKTGYIRAAGFNLVASASNGRKSIIVVVIGGKTGRERNAEVTKLVRQYL